MDVRELLTAARAKVAEGWCQGHDAKNAFDEEVQAEAHDACRWCAGGALSAVTGIRSFSLRMTAQRLFEKAVESPNIVIRNDNPRRTQAEVLAAFDAAIASC